MAGNDTAIIIRLDHAGEMLNRKGLARYGRRRLTREVEEYVEEQAKLLGKTEPIVIEVLVSDTGGTRQAELTEAVHRHFGASRDRAGKQLRETLQHGRRTLLIGFVFLSVIFLVSELGSSLLPEGGLWRTVRESLIILAWVALWRPAELLLYEWYPYKRQLRLFRRLEQAKLTIRVVEQGEQEGRIVDR